ncbi:MAG: hypothetical protein Q9159_003950 [Coniocarpon cinnabarinum]
MGSGPAAIRRSTALKSNAEFTSSLRANFATAQQSATSPTHANGDSSQKQSYTSWTTQNDDAVFIPSVNFAKSGLAEERPQYEITVKLFFLPRNPARCRCAQTREAVKLVLQELHVSSIDLLIVSYPGISFDAEDEDDPELEGAMSTGALAHGNSLEDLDSMVETWTCLEALHDEGVIDKLGVSEFGTSRLSKFLQRTRVRPLVNQINVRDCCVVPKPLILYAKEEEVELLTHNDCTNILPPGIVRELLGHSQEGAGVLAGADRDPGISGSIEPQWVIKYTAVVRNRGVIENKGYFAVAELVND